MTTTSRTNLKLAALLGCLLMLSACAGTTATTGTTPTPPMPPQVTVLQYAQVATASGDTAARVLVALCTPTPPVISLTTCNQVKNDLLKVKVAVDQIVVEANKVPTTETWAVARVNIATIGATAAVNAATGNTALDQDIAAVAAAVKLILGVQ
jgi:hypothetical protein